MAVVKEKRKFNFVLLAVLVVVIIIYSLLKQCLLIKVTRLLLILKAISQHALACSFVLQVSLLLDLQA